jgi:hypothetical protein
VILTPRFSDMAVMALGLKSRVPKKKLVLSIKYYKYQIVHASRWYYLQYDHLDFKLKHLVFLRKICEFHGVEVLYIDLISLKEYLALSYLHM